MKTNKRGTQVTGNIGLYYACYKLSCMGWNVMPTARNARGIDIIAYNTTASKFIGVQVKALSKRDPVPLGTSTDNFMGEFWIIINDVATTSPNAFIMRPSEVRELAHHGCKDGKDSYWLQPKVYDVPAFKEAWHRIDLHAVETLDASDSDSLTDDLLASNAEFQTMAARSKAGPIKPFRTEGDRV